MIYENYMVNVTQRATVLKYLLWSYYTTFTITLIPRQLDHYGRQIPLIPFAILKVVGSTQKINANIPQLDKLDLSYEV